MSGPITVEVFLCKLHVLLTRATNIVKENHVTNLKLAIKCEHLMNKINHLESVFESYCKTKHFNNSSELDKTSCMWSCNTYFLSEAIDNKVIDKTARSDIKYAVSRATLMILSVN